MAAGTLSFIGGIAIVAIWVFVFLQLQSVDWRGVIEHIQSMLSGGDTLEFFIYSALSVLGCLLAGLSFITGKFQKIGVSIVVANSIAVSIMYVWVIAALVASPLLFSYWLIKNA